MCVYCTFQSTRCFEFIDLENAYCRCYMDCVTWCIPLDRDDSMILATPRVAMMMISSLGSLIIV